MSGKVKIAAAILMVIALGLPVEAKDATVVPHEFVAASGGDIFLGDIADIFGLNNQLVARLSSLFISCIPEKDEVMKFNRNDLRRRIEAGNIDLRRVSIQGPLETVVVNKNFAFDSGYLKNQVEQYIIANFQGSGVTCEIEFRHLPSMDRLPKGNLELRVLKSPTQNFVGSIVVSVGVYNEIKLVKKLPVSVFVRTFQNILAANTRLGRHEIISAENTKLMRKETTRIRGSALTELPANTVYRTKRLVHKGEILTDAIVESPPLIERGDKIVLTVLTENMKITLPGRARQSGGIGDLIEVVNLNSRKLLTGCIVDERTVVVDFWMGSN